MVKPHYEHDCKKCMYLGDFIHDGILYDLYVCSHQNMEIDTLIARYGDDGPEYGSGVYFIKTIPTIAEAYKRAKDIGYKLDKIHSYLDK